MATVDPGIFKAYDVRGIYPDQLDEQLAYRIGRAFARVLAGFKNGGKAEDADAAGPAGRSRPRHAPSLVPRSHGSSAAG